MEARTGTETAYHLSLPEWPKLAFGKPEIDGLMPVCRIRYWRRFESALGNKLMNRPGTELIFRGQRRQEWQLTPTLGRYSNSGVVDAKRAEEQKREFRLAMRGRGIGPDLLDEDKELWAFGQHHGLATPLLDWTKSPFVALFFAFADPDFSYEDPNPTRTIFVINKTALEELDPDLIVQPLRNDHTRLVNQAGLFTLSPLGSDTLSSRIFNLLSETETVDMDDPAAVGRYIFKIHVPNELRRECLAMLRKMNIHHGSLFPDPIGASLYCNEWFGGRVDEPETPAPASTRKLAARKPLAAGKPLPTQPKPKTSPPPAAAGLGGKPTGNIGKELGSLLRRFGLEKSQTAILADALEAKFETSAPIDWKGRAFGSASVSVEIKRILRMNGIESDSVEPISAAVFELFQRASSSALPGQESKATGPEDDFFRPIRTQEDAPRESDT
ncbi:FRG domain-containing protein [Brevundimonas sp.]|uniref:FRG domain-containing protein n=1 Tax=Brevundimonas sp. TaxID=1871086 RepID=UPI0035691BD6